jgi:uncharacterized RDD family membrane protein YckC
MSSKAVAAGNTNSIVRKEVVIGFDPVRLKAPFFLRCGAAVIDYLLLIVIPVCGLLLSRFLGNDGTRLVNSEINNFAWLLAVLVAVCNMVLLPIVTGQSVGKMVTGLRIVRLSGESVSARVILVRQLLGYVMTLITGGLGFFLSVFSSKGRALHDLVSDTIVVYGSTRSKT